MAHEAGDHYNGLICIVEQFKGDSVIIDSDMLYTHGIFAPFLGDTYSYYEQVPGRGANVYITTYPTFKKKQNDQSATYASNAFTWEHGQLTLAKMDEPLAITFHRELPKGCKPSSVTVSRDGANRYFVSMLVEEDIKPLPALNAQVGLDLGLKSMVILSTGEAVGNPKFAASDEKRLAKAQRRHAKKKKGSQNREKARRKVARVHARINDRRRDYQHKLSTRIVNENQVMCVESLAVKNMVKNHCLAKAVSDVGWGEFVRQLDYKSQWYTRLSAFTYRTRITSSLAWVRREIR